MTQTKKSLFKASFEESLNLQDDGFLQFQKKEYYTKLGKAFKKGKPSVGFRIQSIIFSLLFPIGVNFMFLVFAISLHDSDPKDLTLPISEQPLLTPEVYLFCLFIWLVLVLLGKFLRCIYMLPYRYRFHIVTFTIWFTLEFNLLAMTLTLPLLSIWGILALYGLLVILAYWMFGKEVDHLKAQIYGGSRSPSMQDRIANKLAIYGMGVLGLATIVKMILKSFSIKFSMALEGFGLFLVWIVMNIAFIGLLVFMEFPFFLEAYYKWKYPEEYREWEGKSLEEWYGKKYLKKHKDLYQTDKVEEKGHV